MSALTKEEFGPLFRKEFKKEFGKAFPKAFQKEFGKAFPKAFQKEFEKAFPKAFSRQLRKEFGPLFQAELVKSPIIIEMRADIATLKSDVATLKKDVATLKEDVHALGLGQDAIRADIRRILDAILPMAAARETTYKHTEAIDQLESDVSVVRSVLGQHVADKEIHRK